MNRYRQKIFDFRLSSVRRGAPLRAPLSGRPRRAAPTGNNKTLPQRGLLIRARSRKRRRILLIGFGNILLKDDAVGVHAVTTIRERYTFFPRLRIIDGGTSGLGLLPLFEDGDRFLLVDAVQMGKEPGHIREFEDEEIPSALQFKLSAHHIGLSDLLWAAGWAGIKPVKVCLVGMEPDSVSPGLEMTETVRSPSNREEPIELTLL